jgi:V/A-type H+-transporting ATPase subunit I
MIVPMRKVTLMLSANAKETALKKLRKLEVLHVENVRPPQSNDIDVLQSESARIEDALGIIGEGSQKKRDVSSKDILSHVNKIIELSEEKDNKTRKLEELQETYGWFEKWGSVSYASVQTLKDAGVFVRFYEADKKALKEFPGKASVHIVREDKTSVLIAYFALSEEDRLKFKEDTMPEVEYALLKEEIDRIKNEIKKIDRDLKALFGIRESLLNYLDDLNKRLEFYRVMHGMGDEEHFVYLQGFCPVEVAPKVIKAADAEGWAYIIREPDNPTEVPTLIRNPGWLRIIDPLFKFMGTLPGYDEFDISLWFLFFFSLFFGIIIGDAGYGLVFLGLTVFASIKAGKKVPKEPFRLMGVLSVTTILWGMITGNWFGYAQIARLPFLNSVVIDQIDSFAGDNSMFMMYLCFIIALVHLSIAHALRAIKIINSPKALGELGWIVILIALFFVAGWLVIDKPLPGFVGPLAMAGIFLTLVFSNFQKNVLKGVGATLGNLPLDIISSFSDVVSYLRLFAVGYASVTVASSFNGMALGAGINSILSGFVAALVLVMGHSLNIVLGLMSVVVHGIRLNMLEFSGHLSMQWAGKTYDPFREK